MTLSTMFTLCLSASVGLLAAGIFYGRHIKRKKILSLAKQGDPKTQYQAALLYYHAKGVKKDWNMAFCYMRSSAQAGYVPALNALGALYCAGHGVQKDEARAFACYEQASKQGDFEGMINLAALYRARKQDDQAFAWLQKAADGGSPLGQRLLAEFYQTGIGTAADEKLALKYYTLAAKQGEPGAVNFLKNRTPSLQRNTNQL